MSKINLLSSKIYNRIAAGEVVERPFSVVKELVENSLDAGATEIIIEIKGGGITSIKITDNGCGIEKSELKKALLPHATSKISKIEDLDIITSLGFRGEALASIASVSKITIVSKPHNQELGAIISSDGGNMSEVSDCGASNGTEITVNNLFYNTPVREKFLKSERSEESDISSMVSHFILGNSNVAFKFISNDKVIYQSFGDGFSAAMSCVYGAEVISDCFFIDTEKNGIKLKGYIGKQYFSKGNRSYQTIFVNNRYVINSTISSAINNAYSAYLMKRQYPFYVLTLTLPPEIVDVNVHPNKLDVRFSNNQIIYGSIYSVISKVLDGISDAVSIITNSKEINFNNTEKNNCDYVKHNIVFDTKNSAKSLNFNPIKFNDILVEKEEKNEKIVDIFAENKAFLEKIKQKDTAQQVQINTTKQEIIQVKNELNYVGQVLNTYLVLEDGVDMYLADQHAAHERIIFDKLFSSYNSGNVVLQPLLIPYILNVNSLEYNFLFGKLSILNKIGIEICEFGQNAFKISAIPTYISQINLQKFFDDILQDIDGFKDLSMSDLLFEKIAQKACKAAIKSGDKLSDIEISSLMEQLKKNIGMKCPHGRPIVVKISRTEIDKWFKRII